jgi:hypothetical protein
VRCDHLPFKAHGKEGVGRQPRRGLSPAGRPPRSFQLPSGRHGQGSQRSPSAAPEIAQIAYFDRHRPSRLHPVNGVLSRASTGQPNVCLRGEGRAAAPLTRTGHASAQGAAFAPSLRFVHSTSGDWPAYSPALTFRSCSVTKRRKQGDQHFSSEQHRSSERCTLKGERTFDRSHGGSQGSNPLTSTPQKSWSPVPSGTYRRGRGFPSGSAGSKRAATTKRAPRSGQCDQGQGEIAPPVPSPAGLDWVTVWFVSVSPGCRHACHRAPSCRPGTRRRGSAAGRTPRGRRRSSLTSPWRRLSGGTGAAPGRG